MVPGFQLIEDFIHADQEQALLDLIDAQSWDDSIKRRTQHYGYRYDYRASSIAGLYIGPLPDWLHEIARQVEGPMGLKADQIIVNEYTPGQGISGHIDCETCFDRSIASLSLGSAVTMRLKERRWQDQRQRFEFRLPPRSLLVLADEARYGWAHEIPQRASDLVDGERVKRGRRVSMTFRKVLPVHEGLKAPS